MASHQSELGIEEIFTEKNNCITSLQNYYLNLDSISGYGRNNERANLFQKNYPHNG